MLNDRIFNGNLDGIFMIFSLFYDQSYAKYENEIFVNESVQVNNFYKH